MNPENEAEETLDPGDWANMQALSHRIVDDSIRHLRDRPVWQEMPEAVKSFYDASLPRSPMALADVYGQVSAKLMPYPMGNIHPRFWSWYMGAGNFAGAIGRHPGIQSRRRQSCRCLDGPAGEELVQGDDGYLEPRLELAAPTSINIVCFRFRPADMPADVVKPINMEIMLRLQEDGIAAFSDTTIHGDYCLRVAINNHRTQRQDLDLLITEILRLGALLES